MKKLLLFAIFQLSIFLLCPFLSSGQDIHFDLVPRPQDQTGTIILSMAQDNQGYLWLATTNGLYKYDGNQYTAYHNQALNPNSISNDYLECIAADKQGYIWIGYYHNTSGLDRLDPSTGICTHFHHNENDVYSLASDSVNVIIQDHEGTIWVGTVNGLDRFDTKTNRFYHYQHKENNPASLSFNQVRAIYEDKEGTLWVGTGNTWLTENPRKGGGLNKLDKKTGKFTRYLHNDKDPHSLIDDRVNAIFEDSHGNFWVGSAGDGLHKMDRKTGGFERLLYNPSHPDGLSRPPLQLQPGFAGGEDHITFITEDNKARLWIGTFNGGINVYDSATKKSTWYGSGKNSKEKLQDNIYWRACKTKDGLLWISTWNFNLYKINPYQVNVPYTHIGTVVNPIAEDNLKALWLGTNKGLVRQDSNGTTQKFLVDKDSSGQKNIITFIEKDDSNRLWLATLHGLYYFDPGTNKILGYHPANGNANSFFQDTINTIRKGKNNKLWLGTNKGLKLLDIKTGAVTLYHRDPKDSGSISNNQILSIGNDEKEDLWIGTLDGINRLNKQTGLFKRYPGKLTIQSLFEDNKKDLWAGTMTGLFRYDRNADVFLSFTDQSGVMSASESIWGIAEDDHQHLWLNTFKGILRMNKDRDGTVVFGINQGVNPLVLTNFGYTRQNGDVLFGDNAGYFTFNNRLLQIDTSRPRVTISSFLLNNIVIEPSTNGILSAPIERTDEMRLNHNQNTFSFGFSSVDFVSDHRRVLYMLQNYDNNWRLSNESREAYYFNLPPGKYVFKVKAYGANGGSDEKQIAVTIEPPWWQTWWAYTIYAIGFVVISFFANRFSRGRIIEKEKEKARERELAQAKEIEKAYKQLELAHENLKAAQSQLIQSEKMASLGELTAGIAHEIQNPLNFVNNFSEINTELIEEADKEIDKGNISEVKTILNDIKENEQKINHHGKRADAIVKGMLQHSRSSNATKESTDINKLADEYLRLAYHGLRAKDKSFNATLKTDFDESIFSINIIPQDIGRVVLNLINNAFYAVGEKKKQNCEGYEPIVSVSTKKINGKVEIKVADNGNGIPQKIVDKIFQPFFTTKPTGQGTGLGLSLSYDIVKAHSGEIKVNTIENEGTEFIIQLPII